MCPAIIRAIRARMLDALIVELAHRRVAHQAVERYGRQLAVVMVSTLQANDYVALRSIATNALNEAAAVAVAANVWDRRSRDTSRQRFRSVLLRRTGREELRRRFLPLKFRTIVLVSLRRASGRRSRSGIRTVA
jgi:hypothetical protein